VHGGSIGRGTDNEWILTRPRALPVGKHARVDFFARNLFLVDTSSNGTYVNGAQVPLGKYHELRAQRTAMTFASGIRVSGQHRQGNDHPPDESAIVASTAISPPLRSRSRSADDLGADLE